MSSIVSRFFVSDSWSATDLARARKSALVASRSVSAFCLSFISPSYHMCLHWPSIEILHFFTGSSPLLLYFYLMSYEFSLAGRRVVAKETVFGNYCLLQRGHVSRLRKETSYLAAEGIAACVTRGVQFAHKDAFKILTGEELPAGVSPITDLARGFYHITFSDGKTLSYPRKTTRILSRGDGSVTILTGGEKHSFTQVVRVVGS